MADYYPLIARAVAGLDKNSGDARRGLYERARTALVAQLRGVNPALSESDVTRERLALEEAIRKVEAESVRAARAEQVREPPPRLRSPDMPRWDGPEFAPEPPPPPTPPPPPPSVRRANPQPLQVEAAPRRPLAMPAARQSNAAAAPAMLGEARYYDPVFDQPHTADSAAPSPSPRPSARARIVPERRSLLDAGLKDFRNVVAETDELGEASARAARSARENYAAVPAAVPDPDYQPDMLEPHATHSSMQELPPEPVFDTPYADEEARLSPAKGRGSDREADDEVIRPPRSYREIIRVGVALVLLAAVGGVVTWQWPNVAAVYQSLRTSDPEPAREAATTTRPKISDRIEPGGQQSPAQQSAALTPSTPQGAAVAQRVVLYEEDPADPNGKRFVGSAIWRTERLTPGPGQSPELAIRADVEIPERKLAMTWSLRRNADPGLPASHTVEIMFKLPADFSSGGVSNVPGILMKQAEQSRGVPLAGLAVKVTNGFFLIGLSASDADRDRNLQLLKERAWFDIPVVYNNNRRAILALEKGTPGERAFAEAFAAWRQ